MYIFYGQHRNNHIHYADTLKYNHNVYVFYNVVCMLCDVHRALSNNHYLIANFETMMIILTTIIGDMVAWSYRFDNNKRITITR